jgi:hypothetical protein
MNHFLTEKSIKNTKVANIQEFSSRSVRLGLF